MKASERGPAAVDDLGEAAPTHRANVPGQPVSGAAVLPLYPESPAPRSTVRSSVSAKTRRPSSRATAHLWTGAQS